MQFKTKRLILVAGLLCAPALADQLEVSCQQPPQGSDQATIDCYDKACNDLQKAIAKCGGDPSCRNNAYMTYLLEVSLCDLSVMETSEDLVVWMNSEGNWCVAWPGEEFEIGSTQFRFNI